MRYHLTTLMCSLFLLVAYACSSAPGEVTPVTRPSQDGISDEGPIGNTDFSEIRYAAAQKFLPPHSLSDPSQLSLADHMLEETISGTCHGTTWLLAQAIAFFKDAGFEEGGRIHPFPQHGVKLVRRLNPTSDPQRGDVAVLYFSIAKSTIQCIYSIGVFARSETVDNKTNKLIILGGVERAKLLLVIRSVLTKIRNRISGTDKHGVLRDLRDRNNDRLFKYASAHTTTDPVFQHAISLVEKRIPVLVRVQISLFVIDWRNAPTDLLGQRTESCAIFVGSNRPFVVCDLNFIRETEIAIRANDSLPLNTEAFFKLSLFISKGIDAAWNFQRTQDLDMQALGDLLAEVLLFYTGHELGHLMDFGGNGGAWTISEAQLPRTAVVAKLCRHAEQFSAEAMTDRSVYRALNAPLGVTNIPASFKAEDDIYRVMLSNERWADEFAAEMMNRRFSSFKQADESNNLKREVKFIEILSYIGIYYWYKDLFETASESCPEFVDSRFSDNGKLIFCIAISPISALKAGKMFGSRHPILLLRAFRGVDRIVGERLIASMRLSMSPSMEGNILRLAYVSKQRDLLAILLDAPLKLAQAGCRADWYARTQPSLLEIGSINSLEESIHFLDHGVLPSNFQILDELLREPAR